MSIQYARDTFYGNYYAKKGKIVLLMGREGKKITVEKLSQFMEQMMALMMPVGSFRLMDEKEVPAPVKRLFKQAFAKLGRKKGRK